MCIKAFVNSHSYKIYSCTYVCMYMSMECVRVYFASSNTTQSKTKKKQKKLADKVPFHFIDQNQLVGDYLNFIIFHAVLALLLVLVAVVIIIQANLHINCINCKQFLTPAKVITVMKTTQKSSLSQRRWCFCVVVTARYNVLFPCNAWAVNFNFKRKL